MSVAKEQYRFHIITLFPDFFTSPLQSSLLGRAIQNNILNVNTINLRSFSMNKHHKVDDIPYGGGAGMVLQVEPVDHALHSLKKGGTSIHSILLTPRGKRFTQKLASEYLKIANDKELVFICGHYEGVDQRVADYLVDESLSVGDYVLSGGEPATLIVLDSIARLIPGYMGNPNSIVHESFAVDNYIEAPQYTRPAIYKGWGVPEVLMNGHHKNITHWREENSNILDIK